MPKRPNRLSCNGCRHLAVRQGDDPPHPYYATCWGRPMGLSALWGKHDQEAAEEYLNNTPRPEECPGWKPEEQP